MANSRDRPLAGKLSVDLNVTPLIDVLLVLLIIFLSTLELSQQVQRAAGAVHLESLFIDEGFGTLDAEALDAVAQAIESLPREGRVVGIVTHLRELTDRLPARIRVEKLAEGSRARLEAA